MPRLHRRSLLALIFLHSAMCVAAHAQLRKPSAPQLVFIDTDIGDDIDDAFALALALQSPDLRIVGITTTFGDTTLRARLLHRLLTDTGHGQIPVAAGPPTEAKNSFTQRPYAERSAEAESVRSTGHLAFALFSAQVHAHPHQVTLIALGPLTTVEFLHDRDPDTFRLLKRVVMMGGSIRRGYNHANSSDPTPPEPEWNIANDISGAQKLLTAGVPLTLLPLDSTQIALDEPHRNAIFAAGSPITNALTLLYHQWGQTTPILFDPLTVATVIDPSLCPTQAMRLRVDSKGNTLQLPDGGETSSNAAVCLKSEEGAFLDLLMERLLAKPPKTELH